MHPVPPSAPGSVAWHLQDDLASGVSLWALVPALPELLAALEAAGSDPDERSHAYDLLPEEVSVTLLHVSAAGVLQAEVTPRPVELDALLDAAQDAFEH